MQKQIKLGIFFLVTLFVFVSAVFIFGKIKMSVGGYRFYIDYNFTGDLRPNGKVCYRGGGVVIGYIDSIAINPDGTLRTGIVITYKNMKLPISTKFAIQTVGFGLGEKYILVTPPLGENIDEPVIKEGDVVRGMDIMSIENVISSLGDITKKVNVHDVNKFISDMMMSTEIINSILHDNKQSINTTITQLEATSKNLNKITSDIANGRGTAGKLISDEKMYYDIQDIITNLAVLSKKIKDKPSILVFPEKEKKK